MILSSDGADKPVTLSGFSYQQRQMQLSKVTRTESVPWQLITVSVTVMVKITVCISGTVTGSGSVNRRGMGYCTGGNGAEVERSVVEDDHGSILKLPACQR